MKAEHETRFAEIITTYDIDGNGVLNDTEKESVMALRPEQDSGERKDFGKRGGMRSFKK